MGLVIRLNYLLAGLSAMLLISCDAEDKQPTSRKPMTPKEGFVEYKIQEGTMLLPDEWHDVTVNEFYGDTDDGFSLQIVRNENERRSTSGEVMQSAKEKLLALAAEEIEILAESTLTLSGLQAQSLIFRDNSEEPIRVTQVVTVVLRPGKSLTFNASSAEEHWEKYSKQVKDLLATVKLEPK